MFVESAKRSTNSISNALGIIMSWAKEEGYSSRHGFLFFIFCGGKNRKKKKKDELFGFIRLLLDSGEWVI